MKTVLITGINGFLGSHLAKRLVQNFNVIGLEFSLNNLYRLDGFNFPVFLSDDESIKKIFLDYSIDIIIHTATVYRRQEEPVIDLINTNIVLPIKLYEIARYYKTELFINTDTFFNVNDTKYKYLEDYTLSKRHVLDWLKIINSKAKLVNMKLFHMYGPNDAPSKFIPSMVVKLKSNQENINLTPGEQKRDFIYIDDVVSSYEAIIGSTGKLTEGFSEFEVSTGELTSIKDLIILLKKITHSSSTLNFGAIPYRENEIMVSESNNKKLVNLGWKPKYSLLKGLEKLLK